MIDRTPVDWRVPTAEWHAFIEYVREEFGEVEGYLGRETEMAMREYADEDRYADVEETIDRLVEAAGRRPTDHQREEKISDIDHAEKERVQVRVDEHIKDEFRQAADQADDPYGVELARALSEYRDGGRAARMDRKVDRIADDAESLLGELSNDDEGLSAVQRNTVTICERFVSNFSDADDPAYRLQFTDSDLVDAISDVVSKGARASQPTIKRYREMVVDRLDLEPHPVLEQNPAKERVWVSSERASDLAPDHQPRVARMPVELLDRGERVRRLRLELGERASQMSSGNARVTASEVRSDVFDSSLSISETVELMQAAAQDDGYRFDQRSDPAVLKVNLSVFRDADPADVDDPALFEDIISYRDSEATSLLDATDAEVTDWTSANSATGGAR